MKKLILLLFVFLGTLTTFGQVPKKQKNYFTFMLGVQDAVKLRITTTGEFSIYPGLYNEKSFNWATLTEPKFKECTLPRLCSRLCEPKSLALRVYRTLP